MDNEIKEMVDALLKRARDRAGSTARLAEVAGVPYGTLSDWVNGDIPGAMVALYKISLWMDESLGEDENLRRRADVAEARLTERVAFYEGIIKKLTAGEGVSTIQELGYNDGVAAIDDPDAEAGSKIERHESINEQREGRRKRGAS